MIALFLRAKFRHDMSINKAFFLGKLQNLSCIVFALLVKFCHISPLFIGIAKKNKEKKKKEKSIQRVFLGL